MTSPNSTPELRPGDLVLVPGHYRITGSDLRIRIHDSAPLILGWVELDGTELNPDDTERPRRRVWVRGEAIEVVQRDQGAES